MASTLLQQISVEEVGLDSFTSTFHPGRMGNTKNIAYGGCTIGVAIQAASQTVSSKYVLYSAMGHYLGPALTDRKLHCSIRRLRDTGTFATRLVEVSQEHDNAQKRICMIMVADFQVQEKFSLMVYSAPPDRSYSPLGDCLGVREAIEKKVQHGAVSAGLANQYFVQFGLLDRFVECRGTPEGVTSNNLNGLAKKTKTTQDGLPITSKTSADWFRCRHAFDLQHSHYAGLAFILDGALSFLPMAHNGMFLDDAGACSSLDFALRFFTTDLNVENWHCREMKTITGNNGRTYSESRLWNEQGTMVADMTQQCILRPLKQNTKASL